MSGSDHFCRKFCGVGYEGRPIFRATCAFVSKKSVLSCGGFDLTCYHNRSKNFCEIRFLALGRMHIWSKSGVVFIGIGFIDGHSAGTNRQS